MKRDTLLRIAAALEGVAAVAMVGILIIGLTADPVAAAPVGKAPAGGPEDQKLDVGIYEGINDQGNPIGADPADRQPFTFLVTWTVERRAADGGGMVSTTSFPLGAFTSSQGATGAFPYTFGKPYTLKYCAGVEVFGICIGTEITEEGYYHISHMRVPPGYCPQFPDGQDRRKSGTTTENQKFFRGAVCGELYPGWHGRWDWGACKPTICTIILR